VKREPSQTAARELPNAVGVRRWVGIALVVCAATLLALQLAPLVGLDWHRIHLGPARLATVPTLAPGGPDLPFVATGSCADAGRVDHILVHRRAGLNNQPPAGAEPSTRDLRDPTAVQRLRQELCALPPYPDQVMHCPFDTGVKIDLYLMDGTGVRISAEAAARGCRPVIVGSDHARWALQADALWEDVAAALGVTPQQMTNWL